MIPWFYFFKMEVIDYPQPGTSQNIDVTDDDNSDSKLVTLSKATTQTEFSSQIMLEAEENLLLKTELFNFLIWILVSYLLLFI